MLHVLMPYVAAALCANPVRTSRRALFELHRRLRGQPRTIHVYLRVDDPYSFLLLQVIPKLCERFGLTVAYHTVLNLQPQMYPDAKKLSSYALYDAGQLADLYGLARPIARATHDQQALLAATSAALAAERDRDPHSALSRVFEQYWQTTLPFNIAPDFAPSLAANEQLLEDSGHYLSATVYFQGEWYWALDRLDHLERRLLADKHAEIEFDRTYRNFCAPVATQYVCDEILTMYFSLRSPYSYLALERAVALSRHYGIELQVKPVLPMVMRNMVVPTTKKFYIFHDTKREADKFAIPYGRVADPLGIAVERVYALLAYARSEGKEIEFLTSCGRGINAQGIHAQSDRGLQLLVERAGLSWQRSQKLLTNQDWREETQRNVSDLNALGLWGVPSFHFAGTSVWGQDRLWVVEREIRRACGHPPL